MKRTFSVVTLLLSLALIAPAQTQSNLNVDKKSHVALSGYDPVAYFKEKKAVEGQASIAVENDGVKYLFATQGNKDLFLSSPSSYKPQYGGWCAYAMGAKGEKVEVDPETFKIVDGKLYLFYNKFFNNTLDRWNKNEPELKTNADRNWAKHIKP